MNKLNLALKAIEEAISHLISEANEDNALLGSVLPAISQLEKSRKKLVTTIAEIEKREK